MGDNKKLRDARVFKKLPDIFGRNESVPGDLAGSTVVQVGTFDDINLAETGGLVIDYRPVGADDVRRLVLAFNDTAMWVQADFNLQI